MIRKYNKIINFLILMVVFVASYLFCYMINKNIKIESLYMDDLHNYFYYLRYDFWTYAFGCVEGQTHYRPIFYGILYLVFKIVSKNLYRVIIINVLFNTIVATLIYYIVTKFNIRRTLALFCSYMYILSHLSCFLLGQAIGILDSISLVFVLSIFYICIKYFFCEDDKTINKYQILICILYFLLAMTYERYIPIVSIIFLIFFIKFLFYDKKSIKYLLNIIILMIETIIIFGIRFMMLKSIIPIGTGNSDVAENFNINQVLYFIVSQIKYMFGINVGPEHLCGIDFNNVEKSIQNIIIISIICIIAIFMIYIIYKIKSLTKAISNKKNNNYIKTILEHFYFELISISFIIINIVSSSITIRLEMRWVLVSFVVFMIYFSYMINNILNINCKLRLFNKCIIYIILILFLLLKTKYELYYRTFYDNIYFIHDLKLTNKIADETIYKYGLDEMKNKRVYILSNLYQLSGKIEYYFYEPYYEEINTEDIHYITFLENGLDVNNEEDVKLFTDPNNIVLAEDYANLSYVRIN